MFMPKILESVYGVKSLLRSFLKSHLLSETSPTVPFNTAVYSHASHQRFPHVRLCFFFHFSIAIYHLATHEIILLISFCSDCVSLDSGFVCLASIHHRANYIKHIFLFSVFLMTWNSDISDLRETAIPRFSQSLEMMMSFPGSLSFICKVVNPEPLTMSFRFYMLSQKYFPALNQPRARY